MYRLLLKSSREFKNGNASKKMQREHKLLILYFSLSPSIFILDAVEEINVRKKEFQTRLLRLSCHAYHSSHSSNYMAYVSFPRNISSLSPFIISSLQAVLKVYQYGITAPVTRAFMLLNTRWTRQIYSYVYVSQGWSRGQHE